MFLRITIVNNESLFQNWISPQKSTDGMILTGIFRIKCRFSVMITLLQIHVELKVFVYLSNRNSLRKSLFLLAAIKSMNWYYKACLNTKSAKSYKTEKMSIPRAIMFDCFTDRYSLRVLPTLIN